MEEKSLWVMRLVVRSWCCRCYRFIMFDGAMRTLTVVLHVPSMNKHLISLGTLDKEGFSYIGKDGVLKVGKGPKLFMKGCIDDDSLYNLIGSTLIKSVCDVITLTKHSDDDTSFDNLNVILISPNKSMGCMELLVINHTLL